MRAFHIRKGYSMATITHVSSGGFENDVLSLRITGGSLVEWTSNDISNWIVEGGGEPERSGSIGGDIGRVWIMCGEVGMERIFKGEALIKHARITSDSETIQFVLLGTGDLKEA